MALEVVGMQMLTFSVRMCAIFEGRRYWAELSQNYQYLLQCWSMRRKTDHKVKDRETKVCSGCKLYNHQLYVFPQP